LFILFIYLRKQVQIKTSVNIHQYKSQTNPDFSIYFVCVH